MDEKQQRRKRIEFRLAGSALARGLRKLPQAPPENPKPETQTQVQPQLELPTCPHGVKLTQLDFDLYQKVYAGRQHLLWGNSVLPDGSNVGPYPYQAKACPECYPTCVHGEQLTEEEIAAAWKSGTKLSSECPVCVGSTDPHAWNQFVNSIGFSAYRGMNPADLYIPTREGGVHALNQHRKFTTGGGSEQMEDVDARSQIARDDMDARGKSVEGLRARELETENEKE